MATNDPRRSKRSNKGLQPKRLGFENLEDETLQARTIRSVQNVPYAGSMATSKTFSKRSLRSIREIEALKNKKKLDAEIHEIEMKELQQQHEFEQKRLEKEKQNLLRIQKSNEEIRKYEEELSQYSDCDIEFNELDNNQRDNCTRNWIQSMPRPHISLRDTQSCVANFNSSNSVIRNRLLKENRPDINEHSVHGQNHRRASENIRNTHRESILENFRQNDIDSHIHNDVLLAAFKALQTREIKDLPIFNGDNVLEWPNFINEYKRSTQEFNINPNKNLRRLNKAIQGNARLSIQTLLTSPDNIDEIISHLEMSFGRPEWILQYLMIDLHSLPTMKEENIHQFKTFYSKLFGAITTIKNMRATNYLENPELLACLEAKLPPTTKNYWNHYKADLNRSKAKIDIAKLGDWFKYELDAQYAGLSTKDVIKKSNKVTILNINSSSKTTKEKWCYKCNGHVGHYIQDCDNFKQMTIDQRREFVKKNNICFMCLIKGHQTRVCRKRDSLPNCSKCNKGHADILHYETDKPVEEVRCVNTCDVILKIAKVTLKGLKKSTTVYAFFDDGSTTTLIDENLANELGLEGNVSRITYRWMNKIVRTDNQSKKVNLDVSAAHEDAKFYSLKNVRTVKDLSLPNQKINVDEVMNLHPYLCRKKLEEIKNTQPLILIGSNYGHLTVPKVTRQFKLGGLIECKSLLGWTIHGPIYNQSDIKDFSVHLCMDEESIMEMELRDLIKESYKIENFGIKSEAEKLSEADNAAINIMKSTMRKVGDRFEVGHLYKFPNKEFPTRESKQLAIKRLHYIERKMDRNPKFAEEYSQKIDDYIRKGYAQKLSGNELKETPRTFYLPHFDVHNPNKPNTFRWVMDAKAKAGDYSLNDLLFQGPDLVPPLLGVLWRARMRLIGFNSDIKEMFHQVLIRPEDRDSQRFLFRGMDRTKEYDVYRMNAMMFGSISSPFAAQFVKNENAKLMDKKFPGVERAIIKQHYVDDYFDSTDTVDEAVQLATNVTTVHKMGGFELVKWISNSPEFMQNIPEQMKLPNYKEINEVRVLGILWNIRSDELVYNLNFSKFQPDFLAGKIIPTKRQMLKFLMSIYDPLGMLSPLTIKLKILFQELWRLDIKWDSDISDGIFEKWTLWLKEAQSIQQVRVPRCYFPLITQYDKVQLHTFSDAGEKAYNAITFIRIELGNEVYVSLVQAKSRVAPIKQITIPRLEMQAAVTGGLMAKTIEFELGIKIDKKFFWTDSTIVLGWINTKDKLNAYVGSRISKILECSKSEEWFWIPTSLNTADLATKTINKVNLSRNSIWFNGPEFLQLPEAQWPKFVLPILTEVEIALFIQELEPYEEIISTIDLEDKCNCLPDVNNISTYNRLIRSTAFVIRMVKNLKLKKTKRPKKLVIDVHDLQEAKKMWYMKVQRDSYSQELQDLKTKGYVKKTSCLYLLSPMINSDGIICVKGRIPGMNPIILQPKHKFTRLLINWYHVVNIHQGIDTVINHLREKFWIPTCRTAVRQAFKICMQCKVKKPKVKLVEMGEIPRERYEKCIYPFTYTGIDFFGPIKVRYGRRYEKVWGALFTCLTTRGVHVELASSLDTNTTIMALTRFMNLRGVSKKIFSDNGTNFEGADNELRKFIENLDHEEIQNKMSIRDVEWVFNCPTAPHRGGAWERMIRSVKEGLKVLIETEFPKYEVLSTAVSEVVNTINNRPLTYVSTDIGDLRAITPNDIILLRANYSQYDVEMDYNFSPRQTWKLAHKIADQFWHRWMKEYRPLLTKRAKWPDNRDDPELKEGDLVRIVDENQIRGKFPKGMIIEVFPDKNGITRTVRVKTMQGIYTRPINKIAKIDISDGVENVNVYH